MATMFFIHCVIRIKTFRSTKPFPKVPSQALLTSRGKIRLADEVKPLAKQHIENCEWLFHPNDEETPVKRQAESSSGPASAASTTKQNAKSVSGAPASASAFTDDPATDTRNVVRFSKG